MKYYLVIDKQNYKLGLNNYCFIDFNNETKSTSLNSIIAFTTLFYDASDLVTYLLKNHLITYDMLNKPIRILKIDYKEQFESLPYGIPFEDDKEYYQTSQIEKYILNNLDDYNLLTEIYYNFHNKNNTTGALEDLLRRFKNYINMKNNYDEVDNYEIHHIIRDLICKICITNRTVNFLSLHKLAMIIINNERKKEHKIEKDLLDKVLMRLEEIRFQINAENLLPEEIDVLENEKYELMKKINGLEDDKNNEITRN